jgi:hypothetical protein
MMNQLQEIHDIVEIVSFVAVIVGAFIARSEWHLHIKDEKEDAEKDRLQDAQRVYREVDQRFFEFLKLCIDRPRLDCYSLPISGGTCLPLTEEEKQQQKLLYTALTDLFEVAFTLYHGKRDDNQELQDLYEKQWRGWEAYIRKFLSRPTYLETWNEIRDEYDEGLQIYLDKLSHAMTQP